MGIKRIVPGVYQVGIKSVNSFILDHDGVTLIDTNLAGTGDEIVDALKEIGKQPDEVTNILITHYHRDHIGNLKWLKEKTGAKVYVASGDADLMRAGGEFPKMNTRGLQGRLISRFASFDPLEPQPVDEVVSDGDHIPVGDGVRVIGTPGHTGGHVCFLWPEQGGVLFVGDAASHMLGKLQPFPFGEDLSATDKSFVGLSAASFEAAAFAHGSSIASGASVRFRKAAAKYGGG